ncbi:C40 family peptidase [Corynebacterium confusum]|uniref:C40 family peptidase n=1 Tax=Corynebacterium confusum TaxID=71254 RepID=UPI0025B61746|nr:C40 family peptidase [Corynebacterium confusum]WJY90116.1 putative endopeptidase precursor [Corynebacterium confusum]
MAKHRRQTATMTRRIATTAVVAASATVAVPGVANATEVVIPNTNYSFDVQGLDQVPNIEKVPNIQTYVPSLGEAQNVNYNAAAQVAPAPAKSEGQKVVDAARSVIGAPYGWGAAGPNSFDCSGLTSWAYGQVGKSIPRTSQAQAAQGTPVALDQLQPGDIVAYYGGASHVGIYTGNGTIIDALNSGTPVQERPLDYMPIHSAVRF